jgi:hypothetical protein
LDRVGNAVVSKTLTKKRVLGIDSLDCNMVPMVAMSFLFTSLFMPPIDIISAYAAGSLLPSNDIGTDDFNRTITNCTIIIFTIQIKKINHNKDHTIYMFVFKLEIFLLEHTN